MKPVYFYDAVKPGTLLRMVQANLSSHGYVKFLESRYANNQHVKSRYWHPVNLGDIVMVVEKLSVGVSFLHDQKILFTYGAEKYFDVLVLP